jgi:hypothetical protein
LAEISQSIREWRNQNAGPWTYNVLTPNPKPPEVSIELHDKLSNISKLQQKNFGDFSWGVAWMWGNTQDTTSYWSRNKELISVDDFVKECRRLRGLLDEFIRNEEREDFLHNRAKYVKYKPNDHPPLKNGSSHLKIAKDSRDIFNKLVVTLDSGVIKNGQEVDFGELRFYRKSPEASPEIAKTSKPVFEKPLIVTLRLTHIQMGDSN